MKIICLTAHISEPNQVITQHRKVTDFAMLNSISANAYKHDSIGVVAQVNVGANHWADSRVFLDVEAFPYNHNTKLQPLHFNKKLQQNTNIKVQVKDMGVAQMYPYTVVTTLYCS